MPDQVAFVVMPFRRKPTGRTEKDVPAEVDFDALWERVYQPVLEELGYDAVRADRDVGALIITQMIQRLAVADLVVADITLANANVYYEIGVRHAARQQGCVLVAANWARPVFDLDQMRTLRFPLADGEVGDQAAGVAARAFRDTLMALADGTSPVFDAVPGFPDSDPRRVAAFADTVAGMSGFEAETRAVRATPRRQRADRVRMLLAEYSSRPAVREIVALELLRLVRDHLDWQELLDYIDTLPHNLATLPSVLEQRALALSETGDIPGSIGQLEQLIANHGETAERLGLLGGRYKRLASSTEAADERRLYLNRAIDAYQRGMDVDLNQYYPASNLAQLYRRRDDPGDAQRAVEAEIATAVACRAAIANGSADAWTRATLLANAFDRGDVAEAVRLRADVETEGMAAWQLKSTVANLRASVANHSDADVRNGLQAVLDQLERML